MTGLVQPNRYSKSSVKICHYLLVLSAALALVCVTGACKKQAAVKPSQQVFDTAAPEIKEMWTQALQADGTNDFYKAEVLLYELIRRDISPEQVEAARAELVLVHTRLKDLASKGDPTAKAAFEQLRMAPPNRPQVRSGQ